MPKSARSNEPPAPPPAPAPALRRAPQRARGHSRVERLLDAAAEVIAEVGVDAASTNAIAARAATSVGSLYQFFPNKGAMVRALAARYVGAFAQLKDRVFADDIVARPLPAMMRGIVAPLAAFLDAHPAYRHVVAATAADPEAAAAETGLHAAVVGRVEALLALRMPWLPAARRHVIAAVQVETVHAVIFRAQDLPPGEREPLYGELVRMLVLALEPLDRRPTAPAARSRRG